MLYKMNPVITLRDFLTDRKLSLLCFPYIICFFTGGISCRNEYSNDYYYLGIYTIFVLHMKMTLKASSLVIG